MSDHDSEYKVCRATHVGDLNIGDIAIKSAVLDDGRRVLNRTTFIRAIGRTGKAKGGRRYDDEFSMPVFLTAQNLQPFIGDELREYLEPVIYRFKNSEMIGYRAELLPLTCGVFLDAEEAGELQPNQQHIADTCKILIRGFATVGIIALVDEATGYQEERDRDALHKILEAYIAKELLPWTKRFPDEFYQELFRLRGWQYSPVTVKRPKFVGKLTNEIVYERLPNGVLEELQHLNPVVENGNRKHKHHQFLSADIGNPHLEKHLAVVTALMRASPTWQHFQRLLERAVPKPNSQMELPFVAQMDADDFE